VSIDPAAQLRHELRTPLNHIIGYAEMLLEELEDGDPDLTAGFAALRADARQLLVLLNEALARGQVGSPDLAAARGTLGAPLERIRAAGEALRRRAAEARASSLLPDLDRIRTATERLEELLRQGGVPPEGSRGATSVESGAAPRRHPGR
jgi:signal transduction histidine kinase